MGLRIKNDYNLHYFAEASAKTGFNAKQIFKEAAKILYENHLEYKNSLDKKRY